MNNYDIIRDELIKTGYVLNDNIFTKTYSTIHQMNINGTPYSQEESTTMTLEYGGEGYCENLDGSNHVILYCFNIIHNQDLLGSLCVRDWVDLVSMMKL